MMLELLLVLQAMLEEELPGVYVHSIMIGSNVIVDTESGFFRDTNRQIREVSVNSSVKKC